jgi:regulator of protease activity HflC (stomatin/prohibitin superfamily)
MPHPKNALASTQERVVAARSGWSMLLVNLLLPIVGFIVIVVLPFGNATPLDPTGGSGILVAVRVIVGIALLAMTVIMVFGYFTLQPNEARVLILFGNYKGAVRESGFHWANPFYSRSRGRAPDHTGGESQPRGRLALNLGNASVGFGGAGSLSTKISLRAHNFNSDKLKVNDNRGNPVEIAAVIVWRVEDTAQAVFDVDDYESYVQVQSESAIRSIASLYAYDQGEENEITLRGGGDEVALELQKELGARLAKTGVVVDEARLTHLAYAPEIASAMLRRQQAEAVIAARAKIVLGAVSMVEMALRELDAKDVVQLDEERRAAMVSNLLVVLCGTAEASPVINTGTLYN